MTLKVWWVLLVALVPCAGHFHHVVELSASNFEVEVRSAGFVFVEFYQNSHNPELDDAARLLKDFSIAVVDCTDNNNHALIEKYHIKTFPTYKLFRDGVDTTFSADKNQSNGEAQQEGEDQQQQQQQQQGAGWRPSAKDVIYFCLDALDKYLDRKANSADVFLHGEDDESALIHLRSIAEVEAFWDIEDVATIAFFRDESDPRLHTYVHVAENNLDGLAFAVVHAESIIDKLNVKSEGEIRLYQDGLLYSTSHVTDNLQLLADWISDVSFRPLRELTEKNMERRLFDGLPSVIIFAPNPTPENSVTVDFSIFRSVAVQFRRKLSFLFAYPSAELEVIMKSLGISENPNNLPAVIIFNPSTEDKYLLPQSISNSLKKISHQTNNNNNNNKNEEETKERDFFRAQLVKFCEGFLDKSLSPTLRSGSGGGTIENHVTVVVGENVWNFVSGADGRDVLLLVYAPWCPHSKQLLPVFEGIAALLNSLSDKILVGKLNIDENDLPRSVNVSAVPTILFFPHTQNLAQKINFVSFSGKRTKGDLGEFVMKHSVHKKLIAPLLLKTEL